MSIVSTYLGKVSIFWSFLNMGRKNVLILLLILVCSLAAVNAISVTTAGITGLIIAGVLIVGSLLLIAVTALID